jgi:hypothetical protein
MPMNHFQYQFQYPQAPQLHPMLNNFFRSSPQFQTPSFYRESSPSPYFINQTGATTSNQNEVFSTKY